MAGIYWYLYPAQTVSPSIYRITAADSCRYLRQPWPGMLGYQDGPGMLRRTLGGNHLILAAATWASYCRHSTHDALFIDMGPRQSHFETMLT